MAMFKYRRSRWRTLSCDDFSMAITWRGEKRGGGGSVSCFCFIFFFLSLFHSNVVVFSRDT